MHKTPRPASQYALTIDKLHIQVKRRFTDDAPAPASTGFFSLHTDANLFDLNLRNAQPAYYSDGYSLERAAKCQSNQFHLQYNILVKGKPLGCLFLDAVKGYETQAGMFPVHLSNQILYDDWVPLLTGFLAAFDLTLHRYTQVDVALDTNTNLQENFLYYFDRETKYHFLQGKKLLCAIETAGKRYRSGHRTESFYLGSGKSDTRTVIYNKSLEIREASGKEYVTRFHAANGLDTTQDVYRIEAQIHGDALRTTEVAYVTQDGEPLTKAGYEACLKANNNHRQKATRLSKIREYPIDYLRFKDNSYLITLFADFQAVKFRKRDASRVTNCTEIAFIDYAIYQKQSTMKPVPYYSETKNNDFRNEKKQLKDCVIRFKETAHLHHLEYAAQLATEYHLTAILNQLLLDFKTDYTIHANTLRPDTAALVLENRLHLRY